MIYTNAYEVDSSTTEDSLSVSSTTSTVCLPSTPPRYGPYQHHANNADDFHFYGIGVVIPFGLLGNLFSIFIFLLSPILRHTTTGQVLVGEVIRWLSDYVNDGENYLHKSLGLDIYDTSIFCVLDCLLSTLRRRYLFGVAYDYNCYGENGC